MGPGSAAYGLGRDDTYVQVERTCGRQRYATHQLNPPSPRSP
jgi:hypothetical protein